MSLNRTLYIFILIVFCLFANAQNVPFDKSFFPGKEKELEAIKKQMKKTRATDDKTHHMFFTAVKGKTLADKIKNDTVKVLNKAIKRKPDILKRMTASKAEKEIRNNISLITTNYILSSKKKR